MQKRNLGGSGLSVSPIVFGGNVFGWTLDEKASFRMLDQFVAAGFNAIDTADTYSRWAPGNKGGESESIIGRWLKAEPSRREKVAIFTKTGMEMPGRGIGLKKERILKAVDEALQRLGTDHIDLFFSHKADPETPIAETLDAYDTVLKAGKVRTIGASNYSPAELKEAFDVAKAQGLPRYEVLQPEYNLHDRRFEADYLPLVKEEGIGVVPYFSLASGFLTGKYRTAADIGGKARGRMVEKYMNARGEAVLKALDAVAARHGGDHAAVALAWLLAKDGVTAPIASATSDRQLATFSKAVELKLSPGDMALLDAA